MFKIYLFAVALFIALFVLPDKYDAYNLGIYLMFKLIMIYWLITNLLL